MSDAAFKELLLRVRANLFNEMADWFVNQMPAIPTAFDINNGCCEDFATEVVDHCPYAKAFWMDDLPEYEDYQHCVVVFGDKYYDAECIEGVTNMLDLPFVVNRGKNRATIYQERGF